MCGIEKSEWEGGWHETFFLVVSFSASTANLLDSSIITSILNFNVFDVTMVSFKPSGATHLILTAFHLTLISTQTHIQILIHTAVHNSHTHTSSFTHTNTLKLPHKIITTHAHIKDNQLCPWPWGWYYVAIRGGVVCQSVREREYYLGKLTTASATCVCVSVYTGREA